MLSAVSLRCEPGESVAILGLNGAGKTTLLRAVVGFVGVDAGRIELFGVNADRSAAREPVAFMPERLQLTPELSGWQSIQLLLGVRKLIADRREIEIQLASKGFPVDQLDMPARTYSKGMAQKIGLVAAISCGARLLILDEPFTGLDARARRSLLEELIVWRRSGRSLMFTAHSFTDLSRLCDSVAVIHRGRVVFHGSHQTLQHRFAGSDGSGDPLEQAFLRCIEQTEEAELA